MTRSDFERELKQIGLPRPSAEVDQKILAGGLQRDPARARGDAEEMDPTSSTRSLFTRFGLVATLTGVAALLIVSLVHFLFREPNTPGTESRAGQTSQEEQREQTGQEPPEKPDPSEAPIPHAINPVVVDLCQGGSRDGRIPAGLARDLTRGLTAIRRVDPEVDQAMKKLAYAYRFRSENANRLGLKLPDDVAARVQESLRAFWQTSPVPTRGDPQHGPFFAAVTGVPALDQLNQRYGLKAIWLHPKYPSCLELEFAAPLDTWRLARVYRDALGASAPGTNACPIFRVPRDDQRDRQRGRYLVALIRRAEQLDLDVYFETRPGQVHRRRFSYHPETDQVSRVTPDSEPMANRMDAVMLAVDWNRTCPPDLPHIKPEDMDRALTLLHEERPDFASYRPVPSSGFPPLSAAFAPRCLVTMSGGENGIQFYFRDLSSSVQVQTAVDSPFGRR